MVPRRGAQIVLASIVAGSAAPALVSCDGAVGSTDTSPGNGGNGTPACAPEVCDGFDNDCDGLVDEECTCEPGAQQSCYASSPVTVGTGICRSGMQICQYTTWGPCEGDVQPTDEQCNGADDDCDGIVDEGCSCSDGAEQQCYGGPANTVGIGGCQAGAQTCQGAAWGSCQGQVLPSAELCNGIDDDCDGMVDDDCGCGDDSCLGGETCSSCPADCGACQPYCGDGPCNGGETCSTCPEDCLPCPAVCGDGVIGGSEQCDGAQLGGATCQSVGFYGGTLACAANCTFDTSGCTAGPTWHWPRPGGVDLYPFPGQACGDAATVEHSDGQTVGLDYPNGGDTAVYGNKTVTSCLRAYFDKEYVVTQIQVRAASVNQACTVPCGSTYCNLGAELELFYHDDNLPAYVHLAANDGQLLPFTLTDLTWPVSFTADTVLVCRSGAGYLRDDVIVDSVAVYGN